MTAVRAALRSLRQQLADGFTSLNGSPRQVSACPLVMFVEFPQAELAGSSAYVNKPLSLSACLLTEAISGALLTQGCACSGDL